MQRKEEIHDQQLRDIFAGFAPVPPDKVWQGIAARMAEKRKLRRRRYLQLAAAAVILLAMVSVPLWWQTKELPVDSLSEHLPAAAAPTPEPPQSLIATNDLQSATPELYPKSYQVETITASNKPVASASPTRVAMAPLPKIESLAFLQNEFTVLASAMQTPQKSLTPMEGVVLAEELQPLASVLPHKRQAWKLGMFLMPGVSGQNSAYATGYARTLAPGNSEPQPSMGGGIDVQYQIRSRWSLGSGIHYSRINEQQGGGGSYLASALFDGKSENRTEASDVSPLQLSPGETAVNSIAGTIVLNQQPVGSEFIWTNDFAGASVALIAYSELIQVFDVVEIPFHARYLLIQSDFHVELTGGVNANLIVGNNAYISQSAGKTRVGNTKDIGMLNFSATAGTAVIYPLGRHLSLSVEPRLNYYFNSINRSSEVNYRPWAAGIYTGITYSFSSLDWK